MKKEVSNSMSIENDPVFDVITPICAVCVNNDVNNKCKARGEKEPNCKYAKSYECKYFKPNKNNTFYEKVKDKIKDANK